MARQSINALIFARTSSAPIRSDASRKNKSLKTLSKTCRKYTSSNQIRESRRYAEVF